QGRRPSTDSCKPAGGAAAVPVGRPVSAGTVVGMTTSTSDIPPRGDDGTPPQADRIGLGGPGDLIAALPGLLGFVPEDSLVLVLLGGDSGRQVIASLRQDLPVLLAYPEAVDDLAARLRVMRTEE